VSWIEVAEWWLEELQTDTAYEEVVTPLLLDLLDPRPDAMYLDLGSGEGRVMRAVRSRGAMVHGVELNVELASKSEAVAVASLPTIPMRASVYDGVYTVLTLEHISNHDAFFAEAARVTKAGGVMTLVMNHPVWTAPDSTPISDADGEVLWRPGHYFSRGKSEVSAGAGAVTFHHRSLSDLLNAAADAGWCLERMQEQPHHDYEDQAGIPRLLACRWWRSGP
jgi:SAM-dependent methyltransferase